jgi:hypothetical protein
MKQAIVKKPEKTKPDTNPHSKGNKEFRERHDISVKDFKRFTQNYLLEYA